MRALIVDDESLARRGVVLRLRKFKDVEIIGECGDGPSAVEKILELSPDVIFLDVQMPGMDGFEVLRALRAFEVHALDYLLKPVESVKATINRLGTHHRPSWRLIGPTFVPPPRNPRVGSESRYRFPRRIDH